MMRQISYYIRGENSSCLVRVMDTGNSAINADLARDAAVELGIYPSGHCLAYSVNDQEEEFYNKLFTEDEAKAMRSNPDVMAKIR